ncbi:MAG: hypothetical protein KF729_14265 [Sandaracinaceae bacterium]|nr:hypothetical protein [Sandaracinaceae bacterium]
MRSLVAVLVLTLALPSLALAQGSGVTVLEAGAAPQAPLRHRFQAGQTQAVRLRVQTEMRMSAGEQSQTVPMPILRLDLRFGPTTVANARLRYPYEVTDVGISGGEDPALNERVATQIRGLVGARGIAEVDARGDVVEFTYELPEGASPELESQSRMLRDSLTRMLPRFPEEPVGVGARWRIVDDLALPSTTVRVGTTYRLVSRDGDRIELEVTTAILDEDAGSADVEVSGSGRLRFQIGTLRMIGRVQTVASASMRGPRGPMRMRIRTRMQVAPN